MQCPKCAYHNNPSNKYCGNCGSKLALLCPTCSSANPSDHKFCGKCGTALHGIASADDPETTKSEVKPAQRDTRGSDSEVRHLTIMFCDLVDSTALSSSLDAEEFRLLVRDYQTTSENVISRFDGHIAQYLGDGLLVYFGYPVAHEDDAMRAVHSGLGILEEMEKLNTRLLSEMNIKLEVRIGVHSGMVVVGDVGVGKRSERLALGEATNIAARIEGIAERGTLAISRSTVQLVTGFFDIKELGAHTLKGITEPMDLYQVTGVSTAKSRLDIAETKGLTPLVGRQQEMNLLLTRWDEARTSQSRVVLLNGGAGVGKSRLIRELKATASREDNVSIIQCFCSPYHDNSAFYPVIDMMDRVIFNIEPGTSQKRELSHIEAYMRQNEMSLEQTVPLFAALFSIPCNDVYEPLPLSAERKKQKTVEALMSTLLNSALKQPTLLIIEDLHWIDASTMELINLILKQSPTHRIMTVLTYRPEFIPQWGIQPHFTSMVLSHLPPSESRMVVRQIAESKALPEEIVTQIIEKTDGIPLFVEELTKSVLESGQLRELEHAYELSIPVPALSIPETLHDALVARLDRLGEDKEIAQLGSAIGRKFSYELFDALELGDKGNMEVRLAHLVSSGLLDQHGIPPTATYQFRHALVQDAAYQSLLRTKRFEYHGRIAVVLEDRFGDTLETRPEMIAHHYTEAGMTEDAIKYWYKAGVRASLRWENLETIAHLNKGLELISSLPESLKRDEEELKFRVAVGPSLVVIRGYGSFEVRDVFSKALTLCEKLGRKNEMGITLWGLSVNSLVHGENQRAMESAYELLEIGKELDNSNFLTGGHFHLGGSFFSFADFEAAVAHFEEGYAFYSKDQHEDQVRLFGVDLGMFCPLWGSHSLWHLGHHARTIEYKDQVFAVVDELEHPFSWAITYSYTAVLFQFRNEPVVAQGHAQAAKAICIEHNFEYYLGWAMMIDGWAKASLGNPEEGISEIHEGMEILQRTGGARALPYYHAMLAEAYWMNGQNQVGLQTLAKALELAEKINESWWTAEIHRLKGAMLLSKTSDNHVEAEASFLTALNISRKQKSISLELRAATSLSQLWQEQGKIEKAKELLSDSIAKHTEGFDTPDYKDAQELLKNFE